MPTVIILIAVAYVAFNSYQRVAEDLVIQRNQDVARLSAAQLGTGLSEYTDILTSVARSISSEVDEASRHDALVAASSRLVVFDAGTVVLDSNGLVSDAYPPRPDLVSQDWSSRPYFRQMFRTPGPVFSNVTPDGPDRSDVVAVVVPITNARGEFEGTLSGMFRLSADAVSSLYGGILKLRLGESGSIYLVDANGRVIYHSDRSLIDQDLSGAPAVRQVLTTGAGNLRTRDATGQEIMAGFSPVPGTSWALVSEESRDALMQSSEGDRRFLLILLALGVVVPTLVVLYGVGQVIRPITKLTAAAGQVASGNFGQEIHVQTGDELDELAQQFNRMSAQLQESYANLERRVADRTRDLATLNAIAAVVSRSLDLTEILEDALDKTLEAVNMDAGSAYRVETSNDNRAEAAGLTMMATRGLPDDVVQAVERLSLSSGAAGRAVREGRPVALPIAAYPAGELKDLGQRESFALVVGVPLIAKGRVLGAMNLASHEYRELSEEEMSLLAAIGQQVGVAMENARLYEKAEEVAAAAERSRLARDLHDAVTQTLFSASLIAEVLPKLWDRNPDEGQRRLAELRQLTRGALAEMRTLLLELRPSALTEAVLGDLVRQLGESVTGRARVPVSVTSEGQCPLPPDVQVAFYRVTQEALNNVAKHSGASQAAVRLRCGPTEVDVCVEDDGHGFNPATVPPDHLGLGIMRERAEAIGATLNIESEPGEGTCVNMHWIRPGA